jgi:hypothetical protein
VAERFAHNLWMHTCDQELGREPVPEIMQAHALEIGQDWNSLQSEMARLFADSKIVLEATAFLTGTGTDQHKGVLTGLTTTQRVQTATTNVYALADVYSLKQALPGTVRLRCVVDPSPDQPRPGVPIRRRELDRADLLPDPRRQDLGDPNL